MINNKLNFKEFNINVIEDMIIYVFFFKMCHRNLWMLHSI